MYCIEIEDLVANALIEIVEKSQKRTVSFDVLTRYGNIVVEKLERENKDVYLLVSRERTDSFIHDYTDFFELGKDKASISLRDNIEVSELKKKFRRNIALDVYLAFVSEEALQVLGIAA